MPAEVTRLSPAEEAAFQAWARQNGVKNFDSPDAHYDMRGYWKDIASTGGSETQINAQDHRLHYPDTYKQHGHPTFSQESQYSAGSPDGGRWVGDNFVPAGADLLMNSRGQSGRPAPAGPALAQALAILMGGR